jgi:hypothetical protein
MAISGKVISQNIKKCMLKYRIYNINIELSIELVQFQPE